MHRCPWGRVFTYSCVPRVFLVVVDVTLGIKDPVKMPINVGIVVWLFGCCGLQLGVVKLYSSTEKCCLHFDAVH